MLLQRWLELAPERVAFQGLPARICWLGLGDRAQAGLAINELVRSGKVRAPVVIGRDHLDSGSVASPYRETEAMRDGSDAIADWPILNALLNTAAGATWVSVHHGGGVGIGKSIHAGMVVVADGTDAMAERLERVLTTDPGTGVMRHADAGYEEALAEAAPSRARAAHASSARRVSWTSVSFGISRRSPLRPASRRRSVDRRSGEVEVIEDAYRPLRGRAIAAVGRMRDLEPIGGEIAKSTAVVSARFPVWWTATRTPASPGTAWKSSRCAPGATYEELHAAGGGILSTVRRRARRANPPARGCRAPPRLDAPRGHDDVRGQVGVRARSRDRAGAASGYRGGGRHPDLVGGPRGAAGVRRG